jgi:Uri superfamily endonuclease
MHRVPSKPGTYTLLIDVAAATTLTVGRLGRRAFPAGRYTYTGSALGASTLTLATRLRRHLACRTTRRWHVDYLLDAPSARVAAVVFAVDPRRLECRVAQALAASGRVVVAGFGASDCRRGCGAHLHFFDGLPLATLVDRVAAVYRQLGSAVVRVLRER